MKKSLLSMAALALIMASCSIDEENVVTGNGEVANAVPVQISQKVAGVETKAAVVPGVSMQAVILMADGENPDFTSFTPRKENTLNDENKFAGDGDRANIANAEFTASGTAGEITLTPALYYPVSAETAKASILGVSPQGIVDATKVSFATTDGSQDVMYAGKVDAGSAQTPTSGGIVLDFKHKTTQLIFVAKLYKELTGSEWENKNVSVKSITVQNAKVPESLTFSNGQVNWKTVGEITVAGCNTALTTNVCDPSVPIMIAHASSVTVNLSLSVDDTIVSYNNLVVQNGSGSNLATEEGASHVITFTITPPTAAAGATKITTSAKVTDWKPGAAGQVTIQ